MHGFLRGAVLAVIALTAGSWVGLGRPSREADLRAMFGPTTAAVAPPATNRGAAADLPPSPLERDPTLLPDRGSPMAALNPERSIARGWMVAEGPRHEPGDNRRLVTLTFDDGPGAKTTPAVLRLLRRHKVKATFFVIGSYLEGESGRAETARTTLRRVAAAGHLVGNHTHDHVRLTSVSRTQVLEQIDRSAAAIERTLGRRPTLFRPPYGALDAFGEAAVRERGLDLVLWSVEKDDMKRDDEANMFHELVAQLDYKEGGIVLLHDVRMSSVNVLERLLGWIEARRWDPKRPERVGYEIVDLPTYLRAVQAAPLPYASRDELERARAERAEKKRPQSARREDGPGEG